MSISSLLTGTHLILTGGGGLDLFGTFIFCEIWPGINLQLYQSQTNDFQQQTNFQQQKNKLRCVCECAGANEFTKCIQVTVKVARNLILI